MEAQNARTNFLENAARTLFLSGPSTSRHLLSQSVELTHVTPTPHRGNTPKDACTACGNLLLPGWTTKTEVTTIKSKKYHQGRERQRRTTDQREGKVDTQQLVVSRQCSFCHRITRKVADKHLQPKNKERQPVRTAEAPAPGGKTTMDNQGSATAEKAADTAAKLSSKKRARARKDREGLQALLNKSAQNKAAPSLGLMDLMKKQ